jgi:hypothetical protein
MKKKKKRKIEQGLWFCLFQKKARLDLWLGFEQLVSHDLFAKQHDQKRRGRYDQE